MIRRLLSETVWPASGTYQELASEVETNRRKRMKKRSRKTKKTFNFTKTLNKLLGRMRDRFRSLPHISLEIYLNRLCNELSLEFVTRD